MSHGYNRKKNISNWRLQRRFLAHSLVSAGTLIAAFFIANQYLFWSFSQKGKAIGLPDGHVFFQFLNSQRHFLFGLFIALSFITLAILTVSGLALSNRVAGPLQRIRAHLSKARADGEWRPIQFRTEDDLQELAEEINSAFEAIQNTKRNPRDVA